MTALVPTTPPAATPMRRERGMSARNALCVIAACTLLMTVLLFASP